MSQSGHRGKPTKRKQERQRRRVIRMAAKSRDDQYAAFVQRLSPLAAEIVTHHSKDARPLRRRWYVLEVPRDGQPILNDYRTFAESRAKLAEFVNAESWVYTFYGYRAMFTSGSSKSVIHPNGSVYGLASPDPEIRVNSDGYFGAGDDEEQEESVDVLDYVDDYDDDGS